MQIVHLATDDHLLLSRVIGVFKNETPVATKEFLSDPACLALVALAPDDRITGWVWGSRQRHVRGYVQFMLYEIDVLREFQRQGIGRMLVDAFLDVARREGAASVYLSTEEGNAPAQALYRAAGGSQGTRLSVGFSWSMAASRA